MTFLKRWFPAIVWMVIIFLLSSRQRLEVSQEPALNFLFFKTLHVVEYGVLFCFMLRGCWRGKKNSDEPSAFLQAFVLTVLYAITDEVHQTFVPTRTGALRDGIIDAIGAGLAWILIEHIQRKAPKKLQRLRAFLLGS